jgi:hypothetical protein
MLRHVALVTTDVSEEPIASILRVTRFAELEKLTVARNRSTLRINLYFSPKRRFLQEPHGITSQKTPFLQILIGGNVP